LVRRVCRRLGRDEEARGGPPFELRGALRLFLACVQAATRLGERWAFGLHIRRVGRFMLGSWTTMLELSLPVRVLFQS
jgi:hypothetical protein